MDGEERVVRFIHDTTWGALPTEVQRKAKMCLLDVLGATLSGTLARVSEIAAKHATRAWKGSDSTILMRGGRATAAGAAFANGYAANAFDTDDCAKYTRGHPGAQLFPTALAIAEKLGKSGQDMLTGMVVGYEVAHRTARCWHDHHNVYQACGSWGSVANAAAAARLMGLDEGEIQQALGIAEYHAPNLPMMRDIDDPSMVKHGIGWGAMTGIMAAELAACGFTGTPSILGFERYKDWVSDIGEHYIMVRGVTFKEFGSCAWGHAPMAAAREVVQRHGIRVDSIAHIRVEAFHEAVLLGSRLPVTTEEAQFSTAWPLAALLVDGEVGPRQTLGDSLRDEHITALASKIELVEADDLTEAARLRWAGDPRGGYGSRVQVTLIDGQRFDSGLVTTSTAGDSQDWSEEQVERKFRWLAGYVLPEERIDKLIETVWSFDRVAHITDLVDLVR